MLPFSVFLRGNRPYYYVAFKNEKTGRYLPAISTKKTEKEDANRQAWTWYHEGIPHKNETLDINMCFIRDSIQHSDISKSDAEFIVNELKRRKLVLSCIFPGEAGSVQFVEYLEEFWDWEHSPYIREKLRAEHSIHHNYVYQMQSTVKKHWKPFFTSVLLGSIQPCDIECFIDHLSNVVYRNVLLSNARKNEIIKAGAVPLRWAYRKGKIQQDVTKGLILFSNKTGKRIILTPELASSIFLQEWADERSKIANLTAMVTGLRAGELQGLLVSNIGDNCLNIRHSWNFFDGLKTTKNNNERIVELPFPSVLNSLRHLASLNPHGVNEDSYVFWSSKLAHKPMENKLFISGLRQSLVNSGLSKAEANEYTFHSWRHFFTTYMRPKIEDKLLQSQTGHLTLPMLDHYSDHRIPGDREKIRAAQIEVFSSLLPSDHSADFWSK